MGLVHSTDLSIESEHCRTQGELAAKYHVMREDCLGLRLPKQVQNCHRG